MQRIFSPHTRPFAFYSTCCPSAPRHGCSHCLFNLIDCLRQVGKKTASQPMFVRACGHRQYRTARAMPTHIPKLYALPAVPSGLFTWQAVGGTRRRPAIVLRSIQRPFSSRLFYPKRLHDEFSSTFRAGETLLPRSKISCPLGSFF